MFDTGSTGFMLVATSLVMLMTPGLAFFYGGLVGRKNVLTIMMQSFVSLGWTTMLWFAFGFSLCFSGTMAEGTDMMGIYGNLDMMFLSGIDITTQFSDQIPMYLFVAYQMMFAIITPALITGAFTNRVKFSAYMLFLTVWLFLVYFPLVHMVWGGGLMAEWGVLDFAGGIVVHASAGMAALAAVFFVGARTFKEAKPHSIPLVALGTGLLWFGWYGFNAGSELQVDQITVTAFLNTDIAASFAAITWLVISYIHKKSFSFVGLLTGAVAGLATITPAAGFIHVQHAAIIGLLAGAACYAAVELKNKMNWDDALDVWGVHGVGGILGTILLGVFASTAVNSNGTDGLIYGGGGFFVKQVVAVLAVSAYAFVFTWIMLAIINKITPVKVSAEEQETGVDSSLHGEEAYEEGAF
jgi:Amt family ammonium transporter